MIEAALLETGGMEDKKENGSNLGVWEWIGRGCVLRLVWRRVREGMVRHARSEGACLEIV